MRAATSNARFIACARSLGLFISGLVLLLTNLARRRFHGKVDCTSFSLASVQRPLIVLAILLAATMAAGAASESTKFRSASVTAYDPQPHARALTEQEFFSLLDSSQVTAVAPPLSGHVFGFGSSQLTRTGLAPTCQAVFVSLVSYSRGWLPDPPPSPVVRATPGFDPMQLTGKGSVCEVRSENYQTIVLDATAARQACSDCALAFAQVWTDGTSQLLGGAHVDDFAEAVAHGSGLIWDGYGCYSFECIRATAFAGDGARLELSP